MSASDPDDLAARHLPRIALEWMRDRPDERWRIQDGTLLFADISGFTALSERLAARGRVGAEELVETLSNVFGAMLLVAAERGGHLLKFGGDALLFLFPDDGHALAACSTAVDMHRELRIASQVRTSVGRLSLSASIGVHSAPTHLFLVGGSHRELVVTGPAVTGVLQREGSAESGQVIVSPETAALLPSGSTRPRSDGELLLRWRDPRIARVSDPPSRRGYESIARQLLPSILFDQFDGTRPDPAHRTAAISFMRFGGTDATIAELGPDALADRLDATLAAAQECFAAEDVALLAVDCDVDGGKLFCSAGVPITSEDDDGRLVRAARRLQESAPPLPLQIGINRGHVFAAEVGYSGRAAFSAMGDTTNTAARICATTPPGSIYVHPAVLEHSRTLFETTPVGPFTFKGKAQPLTVYEIGEEIGDRTAESVDETDMVGRDAELDRLRSMLAAVAGGSGATVIVRGPVGIGKSRLIREALASADEVAIRRVHAEPYGSSSPYRVFRDLVRGLLGVQRGTQTEMASALARGVERVLPDRVDLAPLLADVAHVEMPANEHVRAILPEYRADRTADLVAELLDATRDDALVLVVEDAQWMDDASAQLAERLGAETDRRPWLVVLTHRDDADGEPGAARDELRLEPLDDDVIREIAQRATEAAPRRPHELDQIVERAAGNPLFLFELLRATREVDHLDAVPTSLQGAMAAQVDALDPFARRVLSYASVFGRSFRRVALREALDAEQIDVDDATFDRLAQFLEPDGPTRWRFRNGLVRDVTYDGLGYRLRARLHRRAGEAVEQISVDRDADADTLALHFGEAGVDDKTFIYAVIAGERAARAQSNADAAALFERALDAARSLDHVDDDERHRLLVALGEARERAGLLDGALAAYRDAGSLRRDDVVAQCEMRLRRARVHEARAAYSVALGEATRVRTLLADAPDDDSGRLRARAAAFASLVRVHQERPGDARRLAEIAAQEAEGVGETAALARAYSTRAWADMVTRQGDPRADAQRAIALFTEVGDLRELAHMENNLGVQAYFSGDWAETLERYRRASEACRRVGDVMSAALTDANSGEVLVNQRRFDEAAPLLRTAAQTARALGSPSFAAFAEMHLGRALMELGRPDDALRLLGDVVELYGSTGSESTFEAALHLAAALTRADRAAEALELVTGAKAESSDEIAVFAATEALVTAEALLALDRAAEARQQIVAGLEAARSMGLEYDEAQLLALAARAGARPGEWLGVDDPLAEANRLYGRLGVVPPDPG